MITKRAREAYVLIDHRNSPGISEEFVHKNKLDVPAVGAGVVFESAMAVCAHCSANIILNPQRTRAREWCWKCDAYICDTCGAARKAGLKCEPMIKRLEDYYDLISRTS